MPFRSFDDEAETRLEAIVRHPVPPIGWGVFQNPAKPGEGERGGWAGGSRFQKQRDLGQNLSQKNGNDTEI